MQSRFISPLFRIGSWLSGAGAAFLMAITLTLPAFAQSSPAKPIMTPWTTLTGAWGAKTNNLSTPGLPPLPQVSGFISFQMPTAVAARGNYVYIADSGHRKIFRYDLSQQSMTPLIGFASVSVSDIAVAADLSLYVADLNAGKILHLALDGRQLQTFINDMEMARPVAVLVDQHSTNLWVADSVYNHVVVFNSLGRVIASQSSQMGRNIVAMAQGPDGLYLVDRLNRQVVVVSADGTELYSLGNDVLKMPNAVAVDRYNRVFVSDIFDNTLKVFEHGQLAATVGGGGAIPASFNRITSLSIDQNTLYVADSLNRRIQTFLLRAPTQTTTLEDAE